MRIKAQIKLLPLLLCVIVLLILPACGGGGGDGGGGGNDSPQPQKATVTFALQGSPAIVNSVQLNIVLPDGFVLETDTSNEPTVSALTLLVTGAELNEFSYTQATSAINGEISVAIAKLDGFPSDTNLMQISCIYAPGAAPPTVGDFIVTVDASDLNGGPLDGISEKIKVAIQPAP